MDLECPQKSMCLSPWFQKGDGLLGDGTPSFVLDHCALESDHRPMVSSFCFSFTAAILRSLFHHVPCTMMRRHLSHLSPVEIGMASHMQKLPKL